MENEEMHKYKSDNLNKKEVKWSYKINKRSRIRRRKDTVMRVGNRWSEVPEKEQEMRPR